MSFSKDFLGHFPRAKVTSPCRFMIQAYKVCKELSEIPTSPFPYFLAIVYPNTKELQYFLSVIFLTKQFFDILMCCFTSIKFQSHFEWLINQYSQLSFCRWIKFICLDYHNSEWSQIFMCHLLKQGKIIMTIFLYYYLIINLHGLCTSPFSTHVFVCCTRPF